MKKIEGKPIWVWLAFSSVKTRKAAVLLTWVCGIFSVYCIPWSHISPNAQWLAKVFLLEDWSWFAMVAPMTLWYWMSLKWIDRHLGWPDWASIKG